MTSTPETLRIEDPEPERYDNDIDMSKPKIYVGGRKSKLAVVQSRYIADCLRNVHPGLNFPVIALSTLGDLQQNKPLYSFGGKSVWTSELEALLLNKVEGFEQLDMIVHSLKDMPTTLPKDCILGAITVREDPRDAVCMKANSPFKSLQDLPDGSVVGTSSMRRSAQLKRNYPHLRFESVRGSLSTRLHKLDNEDSIYSCIILAVAGLKRTNLDHRITSYLDIPDMYYAVGQGALGVEIRARDDKVKQLLSRINHAPTAYCCIAERSLMRTLEGGCSVPIGVHSTYENGKVQLKGIVVSVDGTEVVEAETTMPVNNDAEADNVGKALANIMIEKGAKHILDQIHFDTIQ